MDVDEAGTVAAAATAVVTNALATAVEPPPVVITFDRPFLFIVQREDGRGGAVLPTPVFMGLVQAPPQA